MKYSAREINVIYHLVVVCLLFPFGFPIQKTCLGEKKSSLKVSKSGLKYRFMIMKSLLLKEY